MLARNCSIPDFISCSPKVLAPVTSINWRMTASFPESTLRGASVAVARAEALGLGDAGFSCAITRIAGDCAKTTNAPISSKPANTAFRITASYRQKHFHHRQYQNAVLPRACFRPRPTADSLIWTSVWDCDALDASRVVRELALAPALFAPGVALPDAPALRLPDTAAASPAALLWQCVCPRCGSPPEFPR